MGLWSLFMRRKTFSQGGRNPKDYLDWYNGDQTTVEKESTMFMDPITSYKKDNQVKDNPSKRKDIKSANSKQVSGNHYKEMDVQPWEVMESVLNYTEFVGFLKGNIIKYTMRAGKKENSDDMGKARHYIEKLKEVENAEYD